MSEQRRLLLIWVSLFVMVALSLFVAYVTFGVLASSAEGEIRGYKLGGAIAAFGFSFAVLSSVLFNLYRLLTADQLQEYAKRIEELQAKVIKGAPCPPGYTIDLDEKHKLVFARPLQWEPREGVLYSYLEQAKPGDALRANFNVVYVDEKALSVILGGSFDPLNVDLNDLYQKQMNEVQATLKGTLTREYVTVDNLKSAKYMITYNSKDVGLADADGKGVSIRCSGVLTYVPRLKAMYVFSCTDDEADYLASSEVFNTVISSIRFL